MSGAHAPDGSPVALGYHTGHWEVGLLVQAAAEDAGGGLDENDNAIVRLANQIIADAYRQGASDIHVEPYGEKRETLVRFRVDGELSGTYKLVRDMQTTLGVNIHAERIELPYPAPAEAAFYEEYLRVPVSFGARETRTRYAA